MSIRTTATILSAVAGLGSAGAGATSLLGGASSAAPATLAAASVASPQASPACDDNGTWRVDDAGVNGAPDNFDRGDTGAAYVWHDGTGWHLRTTDRTDSRHVYSGPITPSAGPRIVDVDRTLLEKDARVWIGGDGALHYRFVTYDGIDGVNFHLNGCPAAGVEHQSLRFSLDYDGREQDAGRVRLGDHEQHPESGMFTAVRTS